MCALPGPLPTPLHPIARKFLNWWQIFSRVTVSGTCAGTRGWLKWQLAQQEKWFEIQDELFADNVRSIEPAGAKDLRNAEGKGNVRKKGEDWVKRIEAAHKLHTTEPIVSGNHFAVGREMDITVQELGRIQMNEIMLYEVKDGEIVSEQFFY